MVSEAPRWEIPRPLAVREAQGAGGVPILLRRHGNPDGPRLVVSHANGLAADAYYPFWSLLCDRFDLILYDFRNHGWNPVGDLGAHNMSTFVRDNRRVVWAIDRYFGDKPKTGVFHSLSAVAAVLQAVSDTAFSALVLFDPPTSGRDRDSQDIRKLAHGLAERARKRRDRFQTSEELTERLVRARALERLVPGAAELIARTTLRPSARRRTRVRAALSARVRSPGLRGGVQLGRASDVRSLSCPTKIIGADPTVPFSFLPSVDLRDVVALDYDFVPETTHFLQLEQPQACMDLMLDFLGRQKLV